jgi:hypothetical protein
MINACAWCGRPFGLVIHRYRHKRFCRFDCVEAYVKERDEDRIRWVRALLRLG